MEVTVALPTTGTYASRSAIAAVAQHADSQRYGHVWVVDRLLRELPANEPPPLPENYATTYDPLETLAFVAAITTRVGLGVSVVDALFQSPPALARRLATIDRLSAGRLTACLGQGHQAAEFDASGVPMSRRGRGFEEHVEATRRCWGPNPVEFDGTWYTVPRSEIGPKPTVPQGPPLLLGAMGRAVERAGRLGLGWNALFRDWTSFELEHSSFIQAAEQAGHEPSQLPIVVRINNAVGVRGGPNAPLAGEVTHVATELDRLESAGVNEAFFDMNRWQIPPAEQLRVIDQLRAHRGLDA